MTSCFLGNTQNKRNVSPVKSPPQHAQNSKDHILYADFNTQKRERSYPIFYLCTLTSSSEGKSDAEYGLVFGYQFFFPTADKSALRGIQGGIF